MVLHAGQGMCWCFSTAEAGGYASGMYPRSCDGLQAAGYLGHCTHCKAGLRAMQGRGCSGRDHGPSVLQRYAVPGGHEGRNGKTATKVAMLLPQTATANHGGTCESSESPWGERSTNGGSQGQLAVLPIMAAGASLAARARANTGPGVDAGERGQPGNGCQGKGTRMGHG